MTARARVVRAQRALMLVAVVRMLVGAAAVALAALVMAALVDRLLGFERAVRLLVIPGAVLVGLMTGGRLGWHMRGLLSLERVALWIEERLPTEWALVTALDSRYAGDPALEHRAAPARDGKVVWDTAVRTLLPPFGLLVLGGFAFGLLPGPARTRITSPRAGDVLAGPARAPLAAYVVEVLPPVYTGLPTDTLETPETIVAIEGSAVTLRGRGTDVLCGVGRGRCRAEGTAEGWRVRLTMPDSGTVLTLSADTAVRLVALLPRRDSLPVVLLRLPERDTVLREPGGVIRLAADLHDDFGITNARFEYVISSGAGESYTFRSGTMEGRQAGQGIRAELDVHALNLVAGDVAHVRAVAADAGPPRRGLGVSSTRAIRIAREGEYDSISAIALPGLPADTSALSQRLLIQLTEALLAREPRLARATVIDESESIGRDQARLRRLVADIIFMRLGGEPSGEHAHDEGDEGVEGPLTPEALLAAAEAASAEAVAGEALDFHGDETPVVAINRPLLEAYNAMWDASRELNVGQPRAALPHMYRALEAIQRARAAERIYLRGRPLVAALDLGAIRLVGDRTAARPGTRVTTERHGERLVDRLARGIGHTDSLLLLRVELLDTHPAAAVALGDAIDAMREGRSPGEALVRARVALAGPTEPGTGRWGGW